MAAALPLPLKSIDEAVALYERLRDESGEGASTFADGELTDATARRWRISYNGRVWSVPKGVRP